MRYIILLLLTTFNLFALSITGTVSTDTKGNPTIDFKSEDFLRINTVKKIKRESSKPSIKQAFICPQIETKLISKKTNLVLSSQDITFDTSEIYNIDFTTGSYMCSYSINDKVIFTHHFKKNQYYTDLLKLQKESIESGEKVLGFDYLSLKNDINSIPKNQTVNVNEIIEKVGLNEEYETKGFNTYSRMLTGVISFDDDIVRGTDSKGDILFNSQGNTYSDSDIDSTDINNDSKVFGKDFSTSWWQDALTYVGYYDEGEAARDNRDDLLSQVDNTNSFVNRSLYGSYHDMFVSANLFLFIFFLILLITVHIFVSMGWDQIKEVIKDKKFMKKNQLKIAITIFSAFVFLLPVSSTIISNKSFDSALSLGAQGVSKITGYTSEIADEVTYDIAKRKIKELANNSNVYSKDQLKSISNDILNNLTYTYQQIGTLELCRDTYFINSFLKDNVNFSSLDTQGNIFSQGRVISPQSCRNIEGSIYSNMKLIENDSQLLNSKISALKSSGGELSPHEKAIASISYLYGSVTRDFGWMSIPLSYSIQKHYNDIALNQSQKTESELEKNMDSYFEKNEFSDSTVVNAGIDTVAFVSSFAFLSNFQGYNRIQETLYKQMKPEPLTDTITEDWFYDSKEQARSKIKRKIQKGKEKAAKAKKNAKKKLAKYVGTVIPQAKAVAVVDQFLSKMLNFAQESAALVLSHLTAKLAFISGLTTFKQAGIIAIMLFSIVLYLFEIFITIFYIFVFFLRFYKGAFTGEQSSATGFFISRIIYLAAFPVVFAYCGAYLYFGDEIMGDIFNLFITLDIQTLKAVTYSVASSSSIVDSIGIGMEAMLDIGMKVAVYEVISIFIMFPLAYFVTIHMPSKVIKMIDDASMPTDHDLVNLSRKIEGKE